MGLKDPTASRPHLPEPPFVEPTVEATLRALREAYGFRGPEGAPGIPQDEP
jgi:hypothetical protein